MEIKPIVLAVAALGLLTGTALAQEDVSARQLAAMARLAPLAGDWVVTGEVMGPEGAQAMTPGTAQAHYAFNERGIEETAQIDLGSVDGLTELRTLFTYDPYREVYRLSVMDGAYGLLDIYEGGFDEEGRLVTTNLRADTAFPIEGGQLHFKLVHDFTGSEGHDFAVYMTADRGESWLLYFDQHFAPAD
ncbi:DUF1579 family protein [Oceanicaulis sp. LC35]|uniref:DUF1579 family protein n=1 Tax=Oceanicaulis sp. LC35 TaxID=3349635 RepID=UPI003F85AC31